MKYWGPINSTGGINGNDGYVDGNETTGVQGSIPTFRAFEQPLRGLQNLVLKSGLTPDATLDDTQILVSIRSQRMNFANGTGVFGGTANAITTTLDPAPANQAALLGMPIWGIVQATNTGAVTFSPNGFSAAVQTHSGTGFVALTGGELKTGKLVAFMWDGTRYQIVYGVSGTLWTEKVPGFFYAYANPSPGFTTLTASTWTKIALTQEQYDNEGWYDPTNSRFQPTKAGFYYITGDCSFGSNTTIPTTGLRAFLNGTPSFTTQIGDVPGTQYGTNSNGSRGVVSGITFLNGSTDYIELYGFQDVVDSSGFRRANSARWGGWFLGA